MRRSFDHSPQVPDPPIWLIAVATCIVFPWSIPIVLILWLCYALEK